MLQVRRVRVMFLLLFLAIAVRGFAQLDDAHFTDVSTLAGGKTTPPLLHSPLGVAIDPNSGNVFLADTRNHQIKAVSANGNVTILAGSGVPGLADGVGRTVQFHEPTGVVVDRVNQVLYVADRHNHVIRRVTFDGVVSRVAGTGKRGFVDGGPMTAQFDEPTALALAANGSLYVADAGNHAIRRIAADGTVTTVAGAGRAGLSDGPASSARFASPEGIAVRKDGAIVISDTGNHSIRVLDGGTVNTIAGTGAAGSADGRALNATFRNPRGICFDDAGTLFVTDAGNGLIRAVVNGGSVTTISGSPDRRNVTQLIDGPVGRATFDEPSAIAFAGALYVADAAHDAVRIIHPRLRLDAVAPERGPSAGGNSVRIIGSGFMPGSSVTFGTATASTGRYELSTELVVVAPAGNATVDVTVISGDRSATLPDAYTFVPPPTLTSVSPTKGPTAGGQLVQIDGDHFIAGATQIYFGSAAATPVIVESPARLTATTPAGNEGPVNVTAETEGGQSSKANAYAYVAPPTITSFLPLSGRAGMTVIINGDHFDPTATGNAVRFGTLTAVVVAATTTELAVIVPQNAQTGPISVATVGGTAISVAPFTVISFVSLAVVPSVEAVDVGQTLQLKAIGTRTDGSEVDVTADVVWTSSDAAVLTIEGGTAVAHAEGTATVTATFGPISGTAQITVRPLQPLPPDPVAIAPAADPTRIVPLHESMRFLYEHPTPVQMGVASGTIVPARVAIVRGIVESASGAPLPAVKVTVAEHPEFGFTLTRADGRFDFAVNGGGTLRFRFERSGYLSADRSVTLLWEEQRTLAPIVLLQYDEQATTIAMSASVIQVARASVSSDSDGTRRATLLFMPSTTATLTLPDGTSQTLQKLTVRATEYSIGSRGENAMPAQLPPSSAYTYCVELSADEAVEAGATRVQLSTAAVFYIENYRNFPVGEVVPSGYYDRQRGIWMPSQNGRIVKIVSVASGMANLDINGDGAADSATALQAIGISSTERQQLVSLYVGGQSLWRVPVSHFTPYDYNWPNSGPPFGAWAPKSPFPAQAPKVNDGSQICGYSTIDCENGTLGEQIPIAGTPFALEYNSARAARTQYTMTITLTEATIHPELEAILLEVEIAGRLSTWEYDAAPNLTHEFTWDGKDAYGRPVQGAANARVSVFYKYPRYYLSSVTTQNAFGEPSVSQVRIGKTGRPIWLGQSWNVSLGHFDVTPTGFGGWTFSPLTFYDARGQLLYLPNGVNRGVDPQQAGVRSVSTAAGTGSFGSGGDGGSAKNAALAYPTGVAMGPDGSMYVASSGDARIRKIDPSGVITTIAGTGQFGFSGDGGPATSAQIDPWDIAVGPDGVTIYCTNRGTRIRRIDRNGIITTIAGNGILGYSGDGGPATSAAIRAEAITVTPDGSIYIAARQTVRRVDPFGIITTVAGSTLPDAKTGDGVPAKQARFSAIIGLSHGPDGSLYVTDGSENLVRRMTPDGLITTVAGKRDASAPAPDGEDATTGRLSSPYGTAVAPDGTVYFSESSGYRVRSITSTGKIGTLAGTGQRDFTSRPDGALAHATPVYETYDVTLGPDGNAYIADASANQIRKVHSVFPSGYAAIAQRVAIAARDGATAYVYEGGRHVQTVDRLTGVVLYRFEYDDDGRLVRVIDRDDRTTTIERAADGTPRAIIAPGGQRTTLEVDSDGLLRSITSPGSRTYRLTYNAASLLETVIDPRNGRHRFSYGENGRLTKDEDPAGGFVELSLTGESRDYTVVRKSAEGQQTAYRVTTAASGELARSATWPNGLTTTARIGTSGTITRQLPNGATTDIVESAEPGFGMQAPITSRTRLTVGGVTVTADLKREYTFTDPTDPLSVSKRTDTLTVAGKKWTSSYDAATRTMTLKSPMGRTSTMTLNSKGRIASFSQPGLAATDILYDEHGRISSVTVGQRSLSFGYDTQDQLRRITDPVSRSATFSFDTAGRVEQQTLPGGRSVGFSHDPLENLTAITPPGRDAYGFQHTPVNLIDTYTAPGGALTTYKYDQDRRLTDVTTPDDESLSLLYAPAGRLAKIITPRGAYNYSYSETTGDLRTAEAPNGDVVSYGFTNGVRTSMTWSGTISGTVSWSYDSQLRRASENGVAYSYDDDGLLLTAGALSLRRNTQNRLLDGTSLANVQDSLGYNSYGEPTSYTVSLNGSPVTVVGWTYDDIGRLKTETAFLRGFTTTYDYEYDAAGRLEDVTRNGSYAVHYDYDSNGNRTARSDGASTLNATYDDNDRLLTYGGTTYSYNKAGMLLFQANAQGTATYDYDVVGILQKVTFSDGTEIRYMNDAEGRRIARMVNGAVTNRWLYADGLRIVAELNAEGAVVSRFVYGTRSNVPDYMERDGVTYRIITDRRGSPLFIINTSTGAVAQDMRYGEFGEVLMDTNPGFQPFGFAGGLYDPATGLVRFGARDYDSHIGRWTTPDPILFGGEQTNLYVYTFNDPINFIDPSGLIGFGWALSETTEAGAGIGIGQTGSAGIGFFADGAGPDAHGEWGAFTSWGGMNNLDPSHPHYFPCNETGGAIAGAFAGGGFGWFVTNANKVADIRGPFHTASVNFGWKWRVFSLQFSWGTNSDGRRIWFLNYGGPGTAGGGFGASISYYDTNTWATKIGR